MRLDKFLSNNGFGSRKEVKLLIKKKRVSINGSFNVKSDDYINPLEDKIIVDDIEVNYQKNYYFLLNKPKGYISATEDNFQKTVLDLLPDYSYLNLFPVGRLDKDTTGVLLITTDGQLSHRLLSPKYHVEKIYIATVDKPLEKSLIEEFKKGIIMDGDLTLPAGLEIIDEFTARVTLHQGKYHQVKRTFEHFGYKVLVLHREKFSFLTINGLKEGEFRSLSEEEINKLKEL